GRPFDPGDLHRQRHSGRGGGAAGRQRPQPAETPMTDTNEERTMTPSDTILPARRVGRRDLMKLTGVGAAALAAGSFLNSSNAEAQTMETKPMTNDWDKTFPRSRNVDHHKFTFRNRYGLTLAGDLYLP